MASIIVDDTSLLRQSNQSKFTITFKQAEWRQFWQMILLGSVISEYDTVCSTEHQELLNLAFFKNVAQEWREISTISLPNFGVRVIDKDLDGENVVKKPSTGGDIKSSPS